MLIFANLRLTFVSSSTAHLLVHRALRVHRPVVEEGEDAARPAVGVAAS